MNYLVIYELILESY